MAAQRIPDEHLRKLPATRHPTGHPDATPRPLIRRQELEPADMTGTTPPTQEKHCEDYSITVRSPCEEDQALGSGLRTSGSVVLSPWRPPTVASQ
jgi:hypothetical protein